MNTAKTSYLRLDELSDLRIYSALIGLFAVLGLVTQFSDINLHWFMGFNGWSETNLNNAFAAHLTELGNGAIVGLLSVLVLIKHPQLAKRLLFTTLFTALFMYGLKHWFAAPRPAGVLPAESFHIVGDVLKKYSFPSGHTTTAFALAGFIMLSFKQAWTQVFVLILAIIAGWSRVSVGAHWPEDIFAGAVLGLLVAWLAAASSKTSFSDKANWAAGLFLTLAALVGNLTLPKDFPEIQSIAQVRFIFVILTVAMLVYCLVRLIQAVATKESSDSVENK